MDTKMLNLLKILKNVTVLNSNLKLYKPFVVEKSQIGLIGPKVLKEVSKHPDIFLISSHDVGFHHKLNSYEKRSDSLESILKQWKNQGTFPTLNGWRNEYYEVRSNFHAVPLLRMDRSSTCIFGVKNYAVVVNGYVRHPTEGLCVWLQKRSSTRQRWADMWDVMVGGGIRVGQDVLETVYRESVEEASIPEELHRNIVSVGTVSGFYDTDEGLFPSTAFVFDLLLPHDFKPKNADGEVEFFQLVPVQECLDIVESGLVKKPITLVLTDFFVRHSIITPYANPYYASIVEALHYQVQRLYQ